MHAQPKTVPTLWVRPALIALVLVFGGMAFRGSAAVHLTAVVGLCFTVVVAGSWEVRGRWVALWTALACGAHMWAASIRAPPDATALDLALMFLAVPVGMLFLADRAHRTTRQLSSALTTSEIARAKLARSNRELHAAMADNAEALARLSTVVDNLADGLVAIVDDSLELANPAMARLLERDGLSTATPISEVLPPAMRLLVSRSAELGDTVDDELHLPGGRIVRATASPIRVGDGTRGTVVLVHDITLDKELDQMKSNFAATVSHEMRTPMTSVLGFTKLVQQQFDKRIRPLVPAEDKRASKAAATIEDNLGIVIAEGERLTALITDVLDLSRLQSGQIALEFASLDVDTLVRDAVATLTDQVAAREALSLDVQVEDGLPPVRGEAKWLVQVLARLLDNAAKFTDAGTIRVRASLDAGGVAIAVTDQGPGIRPAHRERIFHTFQQGGDVLTDRPRGTGLGLPISKEIAQLHGGRIEVDSVLGEGSCFSLILPVPQ